MQSVAAEAPDGALLQVSNLRKAFPGVLALDGVSLRLEPGTVHAVIGENGAGKSTLMKIIAGIYSPDSGELSFTGRPLRLSSPRKALQSGIAMIHQELNLMPSMSVAENIWLGREPRNAVRLINHRQLRLRTRALLGQLRIDIDADAELGTLSIAARQMVEIARALSYESRLLIMDEPTSALTATEAGHLFTIMRELKARGTGILYITHRMDELLEVADEISVLRDGRSVGGGTPRSLSRSEIIRMMVGRELAPIAPAPPGAGAVALTVRALTRAPHFQDVSFELHAGEILGVAGLVGSGRSELAAALFGLTPAHSGEVLIDGRAVRLDSPRAGIARGLALVTEDRKESGCFACLSVLENLQIAVLRRAFVHFGFVRERAITQACAAVSGQLRVKTPHLHECIENLSGGNQQKVLLGRWLLMQPRLLILDEPTRGVDVGAKAEIHELIARLAAQGAAVLMISSELPEILALSHRIMVMHAGRVTGIVPRAEADQVRIMDLAAR